MDDARLLMVLEMLLKDRHSSLLAAAQTDEAKQHASEFGWALVYIRERILEKNRMDSALAPFTG